MRFLPFILPILPLLSSIPLDDSSPLTSLDFINAVSVRTDLPMIDGLISDQRFRFRRAKRGAVVTLEKDKWPGGRVPYVLSAAYTQSQRAVFARAIAAYSSRTCIRFVPKQPNDRDYIVISKLDGCYADFARVGGRQQVSLADECIDYATIVHEFMHVIGFIHEHQREDRDSFVKILWPNVLPGANTDFDKLTGLGLSYYGEQYDYFSLMHYESNEGSRNGRNTIEATNPSYTPLMGKSTDFSRSDLNRINRAYQCHSFLNGFNRKLPSRKVWKGGNRGFTRFPTRRG